MSTVPLGKGNPFLATIKERYRLSKPGSSKLTFHIVLDLQGSGYHYRPGDSIGIYPVNRPELVDLTLDAMRAVGSEIVADKQGEGSYSIVDFLTHKANLSDISRKFLGEIALRQTDPDKKEKLNSLLEEGHKEELKFYLENHEVWDLLLDNSMVVFTPQEIVNLLMPLLPRLYSIASAHKVVGDEVHLTVSRLSYESNNNLRHGICTYYLCDLVELNVPCVPIYIQEHHGFTIPEDPDCDMIMIGPGTGVAPFKAFMEERVATEATGRNWLFFGECHRAFDYFYEKYWLELEDRGLLQIDAAFSRDQDHKIYVQHLMMEKGAEIFAWLEAGATLFVCGDAHRMAKDVETTLLKIIEQFGDKSPQDAKAYLKLLRTNKRYLRDIY
ncbi:MAG: sulfite reductase [Parachlamydiaceae bacterium]|nr:sulfite reductase [Parachlamydiaceae bacterium]